MTDKILIGLDYDGDSEGTIELEEWEAMRLFRWLKGNDIFTNTPAKIDFIDWKIGRAYIPEDFWTDAFWDDSNGREILDKWGINGSRDYYYFLLDDYEKLKAELEANPHWKVWNESLRHWQYNVELEIVEANGELE